MALALAARIVKLQNNEGRSFAIVDKPHAAVSVFDAAGQLLATSPVLLGLATGDDSVPGIGDRPMRLIKPQERTTPAGRFVSAAGRNMQNDDIVWVDYQAAVSMHRVRANVKADRRLERLASPGFDDNRISYGCINIPADFYDAWVKPHLSDKVGVIYVLPDKKPIEEVFDFAKPAL
ncbi:MAG: L,D-transpeptidase [Variovorax sp.]|nr:MAG: L,D-transpeptidase [Variovorax sp.]